MLTVFLSAIRQRNTVNRKPDGCIVYKEDGL